MSDETSLQLDISLIPFGSRKTGTARPDSDYDVLMVSADLARHVVPQPLPHDEPDFYKPTTPVVYHHQKKREWSLELWHRLGGDKAVEKFYHLAAGKLLPEHGQVDPKQVDLFLYVPPEMSQRVWAVRLKWQLYNARVDFASTRLFENIAAFPALRERHQQILRSGVKVREQAVAIELALCEVAGLEDDDEYRRYASLSEIRRNFGRYQDSVAETGLE